jgi:hypothetical protein
MLGVIREILGAHAKVEPEFAVELEQQIQAPLSEDLFSGVFFSHLLDYQEVFCNNLARPSPTHCHVFRFTVAFVLY